MGQKLVSIKFNPGSSPELWSSDTVELQVQVRKSGSTWTNVTTYYPGLSNMASLPVDLQTEAAVNNTVLKGLAKSNQKLVIKVDDAVTQWQVLFKDKFLTDGDWKPLTSGSF